MLLTRKNKLRYSDPFHNGSALCLLQPLWQRLLGRPASEYGRLCHGDGGPRTGRASPAGANVAYAHSLIPFFHWWLAEQGSCLAHAACVGNTRGAVLLAGNNGAGKSTTALVCLASSLQFISDDRCLLALEPQPYAYSLYSSAKLGADTLRLCSHLLPAQMKSDATADYDFRFFLSRTLPERLSRGLPLRVIVSIEQSGDSKTFVNPASRSNTLLALAPSTLLQLPGGKENSFRFLSKLVREVPGYCLHASTDLDQIPPMIESLLEQLSVC